jgi:hypothetical protein
MPSNVYQVTITFKTWQADTPIPKDIVTKQNVLGDVPVKEFIANIQQQARAYGTDTKYQITSMIRIPEDLLVTS